MQICDLEFADGFAIWRVLLHYVTWVGEPLAMFKHSEILLSTCIVKHSLKMEWSVMLEFKIVTTIELLMKFKPFRNYWFGTLQLQVKFFLKLLPSSNFAESNLNHSEIFGLELNSFKSHFPTEVTYMYFTSYH